MDAKPPGMLSAYYLGAAAAAGAAVLGLEVLAARTMAPALGTGSIAWAALLAVALGSLAGGNLAGGVLADRGRPQAVVAWSLAIAGAGLVLMANIHPRVMCSAAGLSLFWGSLVAAAATQCLPMVMLGLVAPVLVKARGPAVPGRWAGAVLAAGSGGGIAGALVAGLWLLPAAGLTRSYLAVAAALAFAALPAAAAERRYVAAILAIAVLAAAAVCWRIAPGSSAVQSPYGQIEVREAGGGRVLLVDGLPQTAVDGPPRPWESLGRGYLLEAALLLRRPRSALVVGLGGGLATSVIESHGIPCESVEIDPKIVEVARSRFGFDGRVEVADGRRFLADARRKWDLVVVDVTTADRLPVHLFTREAMELVRSRLSPDGVAAMQFIGDDGRWSACVLATAERVFARAVILAPKTDPGPVGPRWLLAADRLADPPAGPDVPWRVVRPQREVTILTDDHFAAEPDWARIAVRWRRSHALPD